MPWSMSHPALPLTFDADYADHLSLFWQIELLSAQRNPFNALDVIYDANVAAMSPSATVPGGLDVITAHRKASPKIVLASAVVEAIGVGREACGIQDAADNLVYEGQPFWGPDDFTRLTSVNRVLISGSGDGALQDYLRVLTHRDRPLDILNACNVPSSFLHALQSAEDRAHRGRSWASEAPRWVRTRQEAPYIEELENLHRSVADQALRLPLVKAGLDTLVGAHPPDVSLVYRGSYLTCYYGLNRFLALLLSAYLEMWRSKRTLYPGVQVGHIAPRPTSAHACVASPPPSGRPRGAGTYVGDIMTSHDCFRQEHDVTFKVAAGSCPEPPGRIFDVVIARHGITASSATGLGGLAPSRPRHLLPYHLPA